MRLLGLPLAMMALGMSIAACGGSDRNASSVAGGATSAVKPESEYHERLLEFRDAAAAGKTYDAYGFAEYFPKTQRAALHAFCFVADRMLKDGETDELGDVAYLNGRISRKAEADLKAELDIVAPRPAHKAIRKLDAVLGLDSLDGDLAERYVKGCY